MLEPEAFDHAARPCRVTRADEEPHLLSPTPAQTGAYIVSQEAKRDSIVKAANIKLE